MPQSYRRLRRSQEPKQLGKGSTSSEELGCIMVVCE